MDGWFGLSVASVWHEPAPEQPASAELSARLSVVGSGKNRPSFAGYRLHAVGNRASGLLTPNEGEWPVRELQFDCGESEQKF